MTEKHIGQVARIQTRITPDYFLARLGPAFIENVILRSLMSYGDAFSYVYIVGGEVVGYISGVCSDKFYTHLLKNSLFLCMFHGIAGVLKHPRIVFDILGILKFLFLKHPRNDVKAEMVTWWVLPEYRIGTEFHKTNGVEIGRMLWKRANLHFEKRGIKHYRLVTPVSNIQSNRFYRNKGYEFVCSLELLGEEKNVYIGNTR